VTLTTPITAGSLTFDTTGYVIASSVSANTLTLAGPAEINVSSSALTDTISSQITGNSSLTTTGSGTLVLSNSNNDYTGATNINAGTLRVGTSNSIPSTSAVSLTTGATLNLNNQSDSVGSLASTGIVASASITSGGSGYGSPPNVTFNGGGGTGAAGIAIINGSGAVTGVNITNPGTGYTSVPSVTFSAPASGTTASGTAVVSGGSVTLGTGTLSAGANDASTTFVGVISGTGTLAKTGSGTFSLTNTNTYGATQILAGVLQIGNGGNSGTLGAGSGSITNNAQLIFNRANGSGLALTISGVISGSGSLTVAAGQLNLTAACTYSGATIINVGAQLFLGAGTSTGSLRRSYKSVIAS
jgi:autotransporter-associated beta strand protein